MKKAIELIGIISFLIAFGVYKWDIIKQPIPKTLMISFNLILKLIISFFFADKRVYFDINIGIVSLLFSINKYLLLKSSEHLSIILLAVLSPLKLIFVLIFSRIIYKKRLNIVQYMAVSLIIVGNCFGQLHEKIKQNKNNIIYIFCSIIASFFGAIAMMFFDRKIRKKNVKFWNYMYTYTFMSLIVTLFQLPLEIKMSSYEFLVHLKNYRFYLNISLSVVETFLSTLLVFRISPLEKGLIGNLIIVSSSFLSNLFYKEKLSVIGTIACFITYSGILIFEYETNRKKSTKKVQD